MPIYVRYIDLNGCRNRYCLPEKPNGYALFMLLDYSVLSESDANTFICSFVRKGYTVFSSSFLKTQWGSDKAVNHAKQLIHLLLKQETINKHIFLCAEGAGGLVARRLLQEKDINVKAVTWVKPLLNLEACYKAFQKNELYVKRFLNEIKAAYQLDHVDLEVLSYLDQTWFGHNGQDWPPLQVFDEKMTSLLKTNQIDFFLLAKETAITEIMPRMKWFFESYH